MNISKLSRLEHDALLCIFNTAFGQAISETLLARLVITKRVFSTSIDVTDPASQELCAGGYTNFSKIYLGDLYTGKLEHNYSAYAKHPQLKYGISFLLFTTEDRTSLEFLEISFFDYEQLPIYLLTTESHDFYDFTAK
ncbi:MAG: hypothetical protein PHP00_13415 [Thiotrichaceae bacterium]|nr:hypothetical protein [Thiotrichaceae bacterium]